MTDDKEDEFDRFRNLAEPASGMVLGRDAANHVHEIGAHGAENEVEGTSPLGVQTSPSFRQLVTKIMDAPRQNAEIHVGDGLPKVVGGEFPDTSKSKVQQIDIADIEQIEYGAPGHGIAALAHELRENFSAHTSAPGRSTDFETVHEEGILAESAVAAELAGTGSRVAERAEPPAEPGGSLVAVTDFETDFLVVEVDNATSSILDSRKADRVNVSEQTIDGFIADSDTPPATAEISTAALTMVQHPQATATVEGFTDDVGSGSENRSVAFLWADQVKAAILGATSELLPRNINAVGRGAVDFVAPNLTEDERRRNRRVRIRIDEPAP